MRRIYCFKLALIICSILSIIAYRAERASSYQENEGDKVAREAIRILQTHCLQCHDENKSSGLDLRSRESMLKGGSRGEVVKPGDAAGSLLFKLVSGAESPRMPLGGELSEKEIDSIKNWIDQGASWPAPDKLTAASKSKTNSAGNGKYWAFTAPVRPQTPRVKNRSAVNNPIDAFLLAGLEEKGLSFSPPADKRTLLRRVTFDLTGLPPTPEEIESFISDKSPDAYEKVVKRLLASPRYGERWGQHWLDVARFAETNGFELDQDREQSWRYRDYVINSLNDDKPYDRFIVEQLAGDELDPDNFEFRVATGFLRAGPQHVVSGNQDLALNRQEWLTEVMFGVGNGILGLTVGCARCHDHKFDPIPQADYYRLQAFFAAADNLDFKKPAKDQEESFKAAVKTHKEKIKPIQDQIDVIEKPYKERLQAEKRSKLEPAFANALAKEEKERNEEEKRLAKDAQRMLNVSWDEIVAALTPEDKAKRAALRKQIHKIELYAPEPLPKALAVSDVLKPVPAMHILKGGDPHRNGAEVQPGFPVALASAGDSATPILNPVERGEFKSTGRRLALARWLTRPDHPLTARVMVNRLWHHHFGRGIVATPNDFGRNGRQPTHRELLDWLAVEFVESGWSLKRMHLLMTLSNAYRQSSMVDDRKHALDPDNKLLWRMNRQRLDAEAIRDAALAASGILTEQRGGPPIRVPLDPEVYDTIFTEQEPDNLWPVHPDARQHSRRTLYLLRKRNVRLPLLVAFDAPDLMSSCGARAVSIHALQSLTLMNSEFMFSQSRLLAQRLFKETKGDESSMIPRLYEISLGRRPRPLEIAATRNFLKSQTAIIRDRFASGEPVTKIDDLPASFDPARAAAWVDLCLATMNLNEFIYLR